MAEGCRRTGGGGVPRRVALGRQLSHVRSVRTLGLKCNIGDYSAEEQVIIRTASRIYFPTLLYADAFAARGTQIFPSIECHRCMGDKIRQSQLFALEEIPTPETRIFFGPRRREAILGRFSFPFIGKIPRGSSRGLGVFLIRDGPALDAYLSVAPVAYIQRYVPLDRDIRVVVLGRRVVHAYWKRRAPGDFRTNVARGGTVCLDPVPQEVISSALDWAIRCRFDHVGLDICRDGKSGGFLLLEANVHFGTEGFREAGLSYKGLLAAMVEAGEI